MRYYALCHRRFTYQLIIIDLVRWYYTFPNIGAGRYRPELSGGVSIEFGIISITSCLLPYAQLDGFVKTAAALPHIRTSGPRLFSCRVVRQT